MRRREVLFAPARVDILRLLTAEGRSDVRTIARSSPQDTSVVSRHLAVLHAARIVRPCRDGRHVFYEVDGPAVVARSEDIVARFRKLVPPCCCDADAWALGVGEWSGLALTKTFQSQEELDVAC